MDESTFRALYPEYSDDFEYTSSLVQYYLDMASSRLSVDLWVDSLSQGIGLFVAHYLAMWKRQQKAAASGNPGQAAALANSKTVGPLSTSYDLGLSAVANAGHWNLTSYGQQFAYLARMVGRCAPSQYYGA